VAIKFIEEKKIPFDSFVRSEDDGESIPLEVQILQNLNHPNIIKLIECRKEHHYILLISELHGSSWDLHNHEINPSRNPGLKFCPRRQKKEPELIRKRASCDLFECIDARIYILKNRYNHS
jgi:serine/threonine protein kinase